MSRHSRSHSRRSRGRTRSLSRSYKGGANYSSGSTYGEYVNGGTNDQFGRVFNQGGDFAGRQSNVLIGAQGQWGSSPGMPSAQNLALVQKAGKSRRKRGGFLGPLINQAVVPFSHLAIQNRYVKNRHGNKMGGKTRKSGKRGGFLGPIINQAVVPFSLLAMQNRYGRKKSGKM